MITKLALWHWHIEISSKCALHCPRCAREEVPETLANAELTLDFFKKNFTPEFIIANVKKITFCGDDGDPIYAHYLIDVIKYFKSVKPVEIVIITNGSYRKKEWWQELGNSLTEIDQIHFSVDGWDQASNEQYRVNSSWKSILVGMHTIRSTSNVFMTWAAIGFSFNEDKLGYMQQLAKDIGFDTFQLTQSTKFHKIYSSYPALDLLQPKDTLISNIGRFTREIIQLSSRIQPCNSKVTNLQLANTVIASNVKNDITPMCQIGNKGLYISSLGRLYPCCWVANRYNHNNEWRTLSLDLNSMSLSGALSNDAFQRELSTFRWAECSSKCSSKVMSVEYCTEW